VKAAAGDEHQRRFFFFFSVHGDNVEAVFSPPSGKRGIHEQASD
jgi:hypothetical protein